jgi:N-acetylated-alpha-linked acidic dipeptidase
MRTVPGIPSLPIGYGEAEKILRNLGGPRVPDAWQGGLPFSYHGGPGGASVELEVEMDEGLRPIWNVFARIPGSDTPERLVVIGNHNDACTHGAVDPSSGTATWLETARGLAAALQAGWRPRRTILLASWDAEEYGLVGSTEWGEEHAAKLGEQALAYINLDSSATGSKLRLSGTPSLRDLVREVAAAVPDPLAGGSVGKAWEGRLREAWARKGPIDLADPDAPFELHLPPLGSGSDYTVFVDHLGVPSVSFSFSGKYGVYHSLYDNFRWMEKFGDPRFIYHGVAARFYGSRSLRESLDALQREATRKRRAASAETEAEALPIRPDFAPVLAALERLETAGEAADRAADAIVVSEDAAAAAAMSEALLRIERAFLSKDGLPGRPWFRHLLYAPGFTTGYAPWPFPELAEAVHEKDAALFETGARRVVAALDAASEQLRAAAALAASPASVAPQAGNGSSNQWRVRLQTAHTESITGTSTRTPTTVASAAPEAGP